jgi:uncharacterized protein (DUF983 family)
MHNEEEMNPLNELENELAESIEPLALTWIKGSHYHCKECGSELTFMGRIEWKPNTGVKAIGVCKTCGFLMVEYEYQLPKWININ